jgi:hypothetical protein
MRPTVNSVAVLGRVAEVSPTYSSSCVPSFRVLPAAPPKNFFLRKHLASSGAQNQASADRQSDPRDARVAQPPAQLAKRINRRNAPELSVARELEYRAPLQSTYYWGFVGGLI